MSNDDEKIFRRQIEILTKALNERDAQLENCGDMIFMLRKQRDEARREVCDMEGQTAGGALLEARQRGWDCFDEKKQIYFCDHCGDAVDIDNVFFFHTLPQDIASANKGESATTCRKCCKMIDANTNNQDFRTTDMG